MQLRPRRPMALALMALLVASCGGEGGAEATARAGAITVFAAASLTDAFEEIGSAFEAASPGVTVELSFAGSSALREQIRAGAPADVFASASASDVEQLVDEGLATGAVPFVTNSLRIVVPAGNPAGITGLEDLAEGDLLVGLCAEEVPCGRFGREALDRAGVIPSIDTNEPDVRALLTKVAAGELDVGIVYVTDVLAAGDVVEGIAVPDEADVVATYPIATLTEADDAEAASAFVAFVLSPAGQSILRSYGFEAP